MNVRVLMPGSIEQARDEDGFFSGSQVQQPFTYSASSSMANNLNT